MDKTPNKYWSLCIYLALTLTTLAVFWQVHNYDFVNYDDPGYVSENPQVQAGLTCDSILWAFTTGHKSNWHPLTWFSHMLDCQLFGTNPDWHHLTNLLLHIANTLLLFGVLKRMTGALWASAFVAAAFGLHPLHIESVAWVAERKDVLSTLFWMLTIAAYLRYVRRPGKAKYLLTLSVFALGLMAKPMLVTLPFVLLLLDYWPLGRFQPEKAVKNVNRRKLKSVNTHSQQRFSCGLIREKVPFFLLSAVSSVATFLVQQSGGAVKRIEAIPIMVRIANASISYLKYIGKMIWPSRLAVFYPHPGDRLPMWLAAVAALLLLAISIWVIRLAPKRKYLPVGWLWYLGTLVPVIGLVQVGGQALANRYAYVPLIGLFIIIAWGLGDLLEKWRYQKTVLGASAIMVLLALAVCTHLQLHHWRNSETLFEHAIEVTNNNHVAHCNLGAAIAKQGRLDEAISHYRQALHIKPRYAGAHYNLGTALQSQGKLDEAISHFHQALRVDPNYAEAHNNLGISLRAQGKLGEAASHYRQALRLKPDFAEAHNSLGNMLATQGNLDEAISHFRQALGTKPNFAEAHYNLGIALKSQGKLDEAISHFYQALQAKPDFPEAHDNLGTAFKLQGKLDEAVSHFRQALQARPNWIGPLNDMAQILATHPDPRMRDSGEAIALAERAAKLTRYQNVTILNTLAASYASAGQFDQAMTTAQKALALASAAQNNELANHIRRQLEFYRQAKP